MSPSERLTSAALARRWAGWSRFDALQKWKDSLHTAADAFKLAQTLAAAEALEEHAKSIEKDEKPPIFLEDDLTPTVPPPEIKE